MSIMATLGMYLTSSALVLLFISCSQQSCSTNHLAALTRYGTAELEKRSRAQSNLSSQTYRSGTLAQSVVVVRVDYGVC